MGNSDYIDSVKHHSRFWRSWQVDKNLFGKIDAAIKEKKIFLNILKRYIKDLSKENRKGLKMAKRALAKFNTRDSTLIRDCSYNVARAWNTKVDYLLLDADHSEEGFMRNWIVWNPFIDNDGVILIQNVRGSFGDEIGTDWVIKQLLRDADFK